MSYAKLFPAANDKLKSMLEELDSLSLPVNEYIIAGSGPMGIRGIRDIKDLDLVVSDELWKRLAGKYETVDGDLGTKKIIISDMIEVLGTLSLTYDESGLTPKVDELIEEAEFIEGHPYMSLSHTVFFKCKRRRKKDLDDVSLIYDWLRKNEMHL